MFLISSGAPQGKFHDKKSLETYILLSFLQERICQQPSTDTLVENLCIVGAELCVRDVEQLASNLTPQLLSHLPCVITKKAAPHTATSPPSQEPLRRSTEMNVEL